MTAPEDLLLDPRGQPIRIDKAYSWDFPMAAHGALHMVLANAAAGDPYRIDTLFLYMANLAWNSSMNAGAAMDALTAKDENGEYKIPHFIYVDAYASETVAYADLVLPDTTYLERWDCISLLDRPISDADAACDGIRQPVVEPDRDVRAFQSVLLDLGARLALPGMVMRDGKPAYPGGYADYMVNHQRAQGLGPLAGWRGYEGGEAGRGAPNAWQLESYIANGCFWRGEMPANARYFKMANAGYLTWAAHMGFIAGPEQVVLHLYSEPLQRFRNAARGHGPAQPPEKDRARIAAAFDPLPIWYMPFEEAAVDRDAYPLHALTQRPMQHYHSWGSQNAWLRQITAANRLFMHHATAAALGIGDDDWVWVISHAGRVKGQVRLVDGVNPDTVWTWNAIGKRRGAWALKPDAPEATEGFLLNHAISEWLPGPERRPNTDPITGQAAWFDLRVRVERATPDGAEPQFATLASPPGIVPGPDVLRYGADFKGRP